MTLVKYLERLINWYTKIASNHRWAHIQLVAQIEKNLALTFVPEKFPQGDRGSNKYGLGSVCFAESPELRDEYKTTFAPIDLLDYIYAVLHSHRYRKKYNEFLKIDFSKVPCPAEPSDFWNLVGLGGELRQLHLLGSPKVEQFTTNYPQGGSNKITTEIGNVDWRLFDAENLLGRIWINENQYFDTIPLVAWELNIFGYRPAKKWLKDRRGHTLETEDILHFQKIVAALTETHRLVQEIDSLEIR